MPSSSTASLRWRRLSIGVQNLREFNAAASIFCMSSPTSPAPYILYLLACKGDVIYTGITNDFPKRYKKHCEGTGAKFTRSHPPTGILHQVAVGDRSAALKLEYAVKQLPRSRKLSFVKQLGFTQS